jgi:hypothetical protein
MTADWRIYSQDDASDFTNDGSDDVLWQNTSTGVVGYWDIAGGKNQGFTKIDAVTPSQWSIVATGDLNGDGRDDILWKSNSTTEMREWLIGSDGKVAQNLGLFAPANSSVLGAAVISHDGSADILLRNSTTGQVGYLDILNGQNTGYHALGTVDPTWTVAAIRDMTADGTPDVVWQDTAGHLYLWNLDHVHDQSHVTTSYLGAHASDWIVA